MDSVWLLVLRLELVWGWYGGEVGEVFLGGRGGSERLVWVGSWEVERGVESWEVESGKSRGGNLRRRE